MTDALRIYFAFRSPFSRLGLHKVARAGLAERLPMRLIPFSGPAGGAAFLDPLSSPPKLAYYMEDAPRMTERMGLPSVMPDPFDVSLTRADRAFVLAERAGKGLAFALAVSDARFGEGRDISNLDVLAACAEQAGLPGDLPKDAKSDKSTLETLGAWRQEIDGDMVFGVPFAVLEQGGQKQKFWGQDRFDLLTEILTG